jgi:hypothetical protein
MLAVNFSETQGSHPTNLGTRLHPIAGFCLPFGAPLEAKGPRPRVALTVRQAAEALQVSTSTAYQPCAQARQQRDQDRASALDWFVAKWTRAIERDAPAKPVADGPGFDEDAGCKEGLRQIDHLEWLIPNVA